MLKKFLLTLAVFGLLVPTVTFGKVSSLLDPVELELQVNGQPDGYQLGQRFNLNKNLSQFNFAIRNVGGVVAKDINFYWTIQPEGLISFLPLCGGQAKLSDIYGHAYAYLPGQVDDCPAFPAGGRYDLTLRITSSNLDIDIGRPVDISKVVSFTVTPLPVLSDLSIVGKLRIKRSGGIVDNPLPVDATFFVGDTFVFPRDVKFELASAQLPTGVYNSGIYNSSNEDYPDLAIKYELRRPGGSLFTEATQEGLYLSKGGLWSDFVNAGYLVPNFYFEAPPFNQRGNWQLILTAWRTSKPTVKASLTQEFIVGSTDTPIKTIALEMPKKPIVAVSETVTQPTSSGVTGGWQPGDPSGDQSVNSQVIVTRTDIPLVTTVLDQPVVTTPVIFANPGSSKTVTEQKLTQEKQKDSDQDGLSDYDEKYVYRTNPLNKDTDKDGYSDGMEIANGYSPLVKAKVVAKVSNFKPKAASAKPALPFKKQEPKVMTVKVYGEEVIWY